MPEKSEEQVANELVVLEKIREIPLYRAELHSLVSERQTTGAATSKKNKDTDSGDSDDAHEDDNDVADDFAAMEYHRATNAAQKSVASDRFKVNTANVVEGKRKRFKTKAAPSARAANRSEVAFQKDQVYATLCCMRCELRKDWRQTTEEVALDNKLNVLITAIELMYTWDQRVSDEAERVRRARQAWFLHSPYEYEEVVCVAFDKQTFLAHIVHESVKRYVIKMPPVGDDDMPIKLRPKIEAEYLGKIGPFDSPYQTDDIEDCLTILKSDTRWTLKPLVESVEEPAMTEEQCQNEADEGSEVGSEEGSEVPSESEAEDEDSEDEDADDEDADDGDSEDADPVDCDEEVSAGTSVSQALAPASDEDSDDEVPLSEKKAEQKDIQEALSQLLVAYKASVREVKKRIPAEYKAARAAKRKAEDQLPSGSSKKAK